MLMPVPTRGCQPSWGLDCLVADALDGETQVSRMCARIRLDRHSILNTQKDWKDCAEGFDITLWRAGVLSIRFAP
jgi:hypothetical protein